MAWLNFKEVNEDHSKKAQDDNPSQTPQPLSESDSPGSSSGNVEYKDIDDESIHISGAGTHE
jgi:hypothetical protein